VLFDPDENAQLESCTRAEQRSLASIIRGSVGRTLSQPKSARQAAWERLLARADASPAPPAGAWDEVKESFERETLEAIARRP